MKDTTKKFSKVLGISVVALACASLAGLVYGQNGWTTSRGDAQRDAWVQTDGYISVASMQHGFGLQWKRKLNNAPRELNSLSAAVVAGDSAWNVAPANIAGSSNNLFAIEIDSGGLSWSRHFDAPMPAATLTCPGGMTATVTRPTALDEILTGSHGPYRGRAGMPSAGPPVGAVGQPGEGVPFNLLVRNNRGGRGASGRGRAAARGGLAASGGRGVAYNPQTVARTGGPRLVYAVASDGTLHTIGQLLGVDVQKPVRFLPANANATELIAVDTNVIYATTINGCGGAPNGVWAIDLASSDKTVTSWKNAASPVGAPAIDSKGTLYVAIGDGPTTGGGYADAIVALDPKTLQVKDSFSAPNASFASTPTIFTYKDHEILAALTKDGRVFLLDTASLGGANHKTPAFVSPATTTMKGFTPTAMATWEDSAQNRWLLAPAAGPKGGNVVAFKVTGDGAQPSLQKGWESPELASPGAPIVVNGVAFVLSTGEYIPATGTVPVAERVSKSTPAVLYALDASTGKELWNSGKAITSFARAGISSGDAQVYVAAYDGTVYAFGFAMDRHL